MAIGNLRVHQDINQPFRILKYVIITRWIVRLRTEHWLLTVRSVDRCAQSAAIAPDHNAIFPVVLLLRTQCLSLSQPYRIARHAFMFVSMQRGRAAVALHRMPIVVDRLGGRRNVPATESTVGRSGNIMAMVQLPDRGCTSCNLTLNQLRRSRRISSSSNPSLLAAIRFAVSYTRSVSKSGMRYSMSRGPRR
jgi:hypothetical protein